MSQNATVAFCDLCMRKIWGYNIYSKGNGIGEHVFVKELREGCKRNKRELPPYEKISGKQFGK